jgi:hypothetical protein
VIDNPSPFERDAEEIRRILGAFYCCLLDYKPIPLAAQLNKPPILDNPIEGQVAIMMLFAKGSKLDRQMIEEVVGAREMADSLVDTAVRVIVDGLNRSAHLSIEAGYESPSPNGKRRAIWHSSLLSRLATIKINWRKRT